MELWGYKVNGTTCAAIGRFSIIWAQMECMFFNKDYNAKNSKKISIIDPNLIDDLCLENVKDSIIHYVEVHKDFDFLNNFRIRDKEINYKEEIKDFLNNISCSKERKILACIYISARVRNNLLHGEKDFCKLNSQIKIFKSLFNFLYVIVAKSIIRVDLIQ